MFVLLLYSILLSKTIHNFRAASTGIGAAPCLEGSDSYVSAGDCGEAVGCHEHCETWAYAPEEMEDFRRTKRYQYYMGGVVSPPNAKENILYEYGIIETESGR